MGETKQEDVIKVKESIDRFLKIYKNLSAPEKTTFEKQINAMVDKLDEKTKKLYTTLIAAAKKEMVSAQAIDEMRKSWEPK